MTPNNKMLFSYADLVERWGVSLLTVKRLVGSRCLVSTHIGGRRFVPRAEVERAEREGCGTARKHSGLQSGVSNG